ncbi:hypothetical protein N2152v2_000168 [Parachlorella kessleri]
MVFFYFWMLLPFLRHSKKESRRVAELLSQLPPEMDVMNLVLSSTNQQEEEDVSHHKHGSGVGLRVALVGTHDVSRKVKAYKEQMHRHHAEGGSEAEDPTLWESHRTPRKISFA